LHDTQQRFLSALTQFDQGSAEAQFREFLPPPVGTVAGRWHIYASGYINRVRDALREDYRAVARIVGDQPFDQLVQRYLLRFPPRAFDLAMVGDRLKLYIDSDPLAKQLPFLADLVVLERAISESFVAADRPVLTWADLTALAPQDAALLRLELQPSCVIVRSRWPLRDLWSTAFEPDDALIDIELNEADRAFVVLREDDSIFVREISDELAHLLEQVQRTTPRLNELGEQLSLSDDPDDVRHFLALLARAMSMPVFAH
jgi:hypothetical protein